MENMTDYKNPTQLKNLMLNVTDACNLRCIYCFVAQHPHYMSLKVAKDTVDFIIDMNQESQYNPKVSSPNINFFGGEPMLMWDQIVVPLVEYAFLEKKYNMSFSITSNCTLLTQEKVDFMKKYNIGLLFSIDGDKETQDYNRPFPNKKVSSFDVLEPKIPMIVKNFPNTTFRSTITPPMVHKIFDNIMFAKSCGFKHTFSCPNEFDTWTDEQIATMKNEFDKYMLYFIDAYSKPELPSDFIRWSPFFTGITEAEQIRAKAKNGTPYKLVGESMCGLGLGSGAVNYEGAIFGCQELVSHGYDDNLHYLGDIYNGLDKNRQDALLATYKGHDLMCEEPELCKDCIKRYICSRGFCHANSYMKFNKSYMKSKIRCLYDSFLIEAANSASMTLNKMEGDNAFKKEFIKTGKIKTL